MNVGDRVVALRQVAYFSYRIPKGTEGFITLVNESSANVVLVEFVGYEGFQVPCVYDEEVGGLDEEPGT